MRVLLFFIKNFLFFLLILSTSCSDVSITYEQKLKSKRQFIEAGFYGANSPLLPNDKKKFNGLNFFKIDSTYRITAKVEWDLNCAAIQVYKDSGELSNNYPTAKLSFVVNGKVSKLTGYSKSKKNISSLFVPFYDLTTGIETYGGGRFLDVDVKSNQQVVLDFNTAYNPYCVYNPNYICPVPPVINNLKVKVLAGEKLPLIDNH